MRNFIIFGLFFIAMGLSGQVDVTRALWDTSSAGEGFTLWGILDDNGGFLETWGFTNRPNGAGFLFVNYHYNDDGTRMGIIGSYIVERGTIYVEYQQVEMADAITNQVSTRYSVSDTAYDSISVGESDGIRFVAIGGTVFYLTEDLLRLLDEAEALAGGGENVEEVVEGVKG